MRLETTIIGHPTRPQLVEFAESLVDRHAPVSAVMAAHVANCPRCAREVKQIRTSFAVAAIAHLPEPSQELTTCIMARARQERARHHVATCKQRLTLRRIALNAACIGGTIILAYFSFGSILGGADSSAVSRYVPENAFAETSTRYGFVEERAAAVQALSSAVSVQQKMAASPQETGQRRALDVFGRDMSAALDALERNPGCVRANQVMAVSVDRQLEELRNLYLDRTL